MRVLSGLQWLVSVLCLGASAASAMLGAAVLILQLSGCNAMEGKCPKCPNCVQSNGDSPTCSVPIDGQCMSSSTCEPTSDAPAGTTCGCAGIRRPSGQIECLCQTP
jgi:hypothetical protein